MRFRDNKKVLGVLLKAIQLIEQTPSLLKVFESLLLDESLYSHSASVAKIAVQIGLSLNFKNDDLLELAVGGLLHDVGKLKIKSSILYKPTKLTNEEILLIKKHPVDGFEMLKNTGVSQNILDMVRYHHEMVDGSGYAEGRSDISMLVQIITVADITSALTEQRCYHSAMSVDTALEYIGKFNNINQGVVAVLNGLISD